MLRQHPDEQLGPDAVSLAIPVESESRRSRRVFCTVRKSARGEMLAGLRPGTAR